MNKVLDTWNNKKIVFEGNYTKCIEYIKSNNIYQANYSKLVLETIEIVITKEDIDFKLDSSKDFANIFNCPLVKACKRILNEDNIIVGVYSLHILDKKIIVNFTRYFTFDIYKELRENKINNFQTNVLLKYN